MSVERTVLGAGGVREDGMSSLSDSRVCGWLSPREGTNQNKALQIFSMCSNVVQICQGSVLMVARWAMHAFI